ncbi:hypothetical protein [Alsobacter sp. SYSU BS001988]
MRRPQLTPVMPSETIDWPIEPVSVAPASTTLHPALGALARLLARQIAAEIAGAPATVARRSRGDATPPTQETQS